jgi:predicted transcriptional regulator
MPVVFSHTSLFRKLYQYTTIEMVSRMRAGLRVNELADLADVSESTLRKMLRGDAVSSVLVYKVLRILSERLGREITINDVRGLTIL